MKRFVVFSFIVILMFGCISTNKPLETKPVISVDPYVMNWFKKPAALSPEKIAVLVLSKESLKEYGFLKHNKGNYYTGRLTRDQLKLLLNDKRVLRISGGEQKLQH
ncbi:hypothetical protein ACX8XP_16405 [Calditrichota bacterium LG25]